MEKIIKPNSKLYTSEFASVLFASVFFLSVFLSTFLLSSSLAFACINPTIYNENGALLNPLGGAGKITINGTNYAEMQIDFPVEIKNKNDDGMTVTLRPYSSLRDYIDDASIHMQPNETSQLNLRTWVGGQSYIGIMQVYFSCDSEGAVWSWPIVNVLIIGQELEPPNTSTCDSHNLDGCYGGMQRDYYCSRGNLSYSARCTDDCCQSFGGVESVCSNDRRSCLTFNTLPPGTEGNIAFVCRDEKCSDGNEKSLMFMLRYSGWNLTAHPVEGWTEADIKKYDIIACANERDACSFDFNSMLYKMHTNERKPFLEMPYSKSISAAYTFDYITSDRTSYGKEQPFINPLNYDYITEGYAGSVQTTRNAERYTSVALSNSYLTSSVKNLADSDNGKSRYGPSSVMFKVKETVDHGRYAYIGWLYGSTSLTKDGGVLLNKTLKWLKGGDAAFGGQNDDTPRKGKIAFVCQKDDCGRDNEMELMKYLRKSGYYVTGKSSVVDKYNEGWTASTLSGYDLIICADSKTCKIDAISPLYSAYEYSGKDFLEIPYNGGVYAAQAFGYVHSRASRESSYGIIPQGTDAAFPIFSDFKGYMDIAKEDDISVYGPESADLNPALTLAKVPDSDVSTMFAYDAAGSRGRYAYVGWMPDVNELNENGKKLLTRTIDWLLCGNSCLPSFSSTFGDLSLKFEIYSPTNTTYSTKKIYLNISATQRVAQMTYSINDKRPSRLCYDCSEVYKRLSVKDGPNKLNVTLTEYTGATTSRVIYFSVND